jgi:hypothetical protein
MVDPVTATAAAVYLADRVSDRIARARQRRKLMLLASTLGPVTEVGERYGRDAGWYVRISAAAAKAEVSR